MLHASSRVLYPTILEFLNVIFLFCLDSLYERNFYLLPSFPKPRPSCTLCIAPTFLMPFLSPSLRRSQNISFLSFFLSLPLTSFSGVRTSLRTSMISRCFQPSFMLHLPLFLVAPFSFVHGMKLNGATRIRDVVKCLIYELKN